MQFYELFFSVLSNSKKNLSGESSFIKISLKEGSKVEYVEEEGKKGKQATNISLVE